MLTFEERIWLKVDRSETLTQCWIWNGRLDPSGYGPHRKVWELANGKIPEGFELDHLCRTRNCVKPEHLELVTHTENVRRGRLYAALRYNCKNEAPRRSVK